MKLVVGLGNPGLKYETTRHNVGFLAVDYLADKWKADGPQKQNQAQVFKATLGNESILLIKPQTFMNLSGKSVGPFFQFYKCQPDDLIVVHDEIDILPLEIRIKTGGGNAGHNGLKSIDEAVGAKALNYNKIRLGVGHPRLKSETARLSPATYVLQPFLDNELEKLPTLFDWLDEVIRLIVQGKKTEAMNRFNKRRVEEEE